MCHSPASDVVDTVGIICCLRKLRILRVQMCIVMHTYTECCGIMHPQQKCALGTSFTGVSSWHLPSHALHVLTGRGPDALHRYNGKSSNTPNLTA